MQTWGARHATHSLSLSLLIAYAPTPLARPPRSNADDKFKNKASRVIIACDDGGFRSEKAASLVAALGYSAIYTVEGGIDAYLAVSPLQDKDKKARVARVEQFVGVKYGGTGVTSSQTPDDSA